MRRRPGCSSGAAQPVDVVATRRRGSGPCGRSRFGALLAARPGRAPSRGCAPAPSRRRRRRPSTPVSRIVTLRSSISPITSVSVGRCSKRRMLTSAGGDHLAGVDAASPGSSARRSGGGRTPRRPGRARAAGGRRTRSTTTTSRTLPDLVALGVEHRQARPGGRRRRGSGRCSRATRALAAGDTGVMPMRHPVAPTTSSTCSPTGRSPATSWPSCTAPTTCPPAVPGDRPGVRLLGDDVPGRGGRRAARVRHPRSSPPSRRSRSPATRRSARRGCCAARGPARPPTSASRSAAPARSGCASTGEPVGRAHRDAARPGGPAAADVVRGLLRAAGSALSDLAGEAWVAGCGLTLRARPGAPRRPWSGRSARQRLPALAERLAGLGRVDDLLDAVNVYAVRGYAPHLDVHSRVFVPGRRCPGGPGDRVGRRRPGTGPGRDRSAARRAAATRSARASRWAGRRRCPVGWTPPAGRATHCHVAGAGAAGGLRRDRRPARLLSARVRTASGGA